ncbi:hypothetical protein pdam_00024891 [Pocillopora damicornis]|uniref:Uncharacterized protein n=1 Tax=Pocillopora damicornis TaxID=46731 RepID=A0A3M6UXG4_POCDA|nr:hypothetical protein pdam_00024891 [Pocillopora damicornis]
MASGGYLSSLEEASKSFPLFSLLKESSCSDSTSYEWRLKEDALQSLRRIKTEKGSRADMWCHFGKVVIRGLDICVLNKDSDKTVKEKAVPFSDVKNIFEEIYFEE